MAHLAISLLGSFQVLLDGEPAPFKTDKTRALLAYLAVEASQPHRHLHVVGRRGRVEMGPQMLADIVRGNVLLTARQEQGQQRQGPRPGDSGIQPHRPAPDLKVAKQPELELIHRG